MSDEDEEKDKTRKKKRLLSTEELKEKPKIKVKEAEKKHESEEENTYNEDSGDEKPKDAIQPEIMTQVRAITPPKRGALRSEVMVQHIAESPPPVKLQSQVVFKGKVFERYVELKKIFFECFEMAL